MVSKAMEWLEPWSPLGAERAAKLEKQLELEVGVRHALFGKRAHALAARVDRDEVLFDIVGIPHVVHLTWTPTADGEIRFPSFDRFSSFDAWVERMKRDHDEWMPS